MDAISKFGAPIVAGVPRVQAIEAPTARCPRCDRQSELVGYIALTAEDGSVPYRGCLTCLGVWAGEVATGAQCHADAHEASANLAGCVNWLADAGDRMVEQIAILASALSVFTSNPLIRALPLPVTEQQAVALERGVAALERLFATEEATE